MVLFLLIFILALIGQLFLPWWVVVPIAMLCCMWRAQTARSAFIISFLSIFTLWLITSLILSIPNNHLLANRVGQMLGLPDSPYNWLPVALIATLPGALTAGFSGLGGFFSRKILGNN